MTWNFCPVGGRWSIMFKSHTVKSGDTLGAIAVRYYGLFPRWTLIRDGNPQLANRKKASDGSPLIFIGDMLIIPQEVTLPPAVAPVFSPPVLLADDTAQDIAVYVDGKLFSGFTGYRIIMPVDSFDTFSFSAPFDDIKDVIRAAFKPFSYKLCTVYYDKELIFAGRLLTTAPEVSPNSKTITIQGYPLCGVLNDCCLPETMYPPEYDGLTVVQIAEHAASAFGVQVQCDNPPGEVFTDVGYEPGEKILAFIKKLSEQRGLLFTNTPSGGLLFWVPKNEPVSATFKEGSLPFVSCKPTFSEQTMFSHITGFSKVEGDTDPESFTYENQYLIKNNVLRPYSFVVEDAESGTLEGSVKAAAGRMFASSVAYSLIVIGHRDANGALYRKNMTVSVLAPGAMIYNETKLQVDQVELLRSDTEGNQTIFSLVLPGSRNGELPEVFPWEE